MSGITRWRAAGQPTLTAYGGYQLGQVQRAQGYLDATVQTCLRSLDFTAPPDQATPPTACRRMWAWPKWLTSEMSSTRRCGM